MRVRPRRRPHQHRPRSSTGGSAPADPDQNLPAVGSLSLTLDRLRSDTTRRPAERDSFTLDGTAPRRRPQGRHATSIASGAPRDTARARPAPSPRPTTCRPPQGLASSASGFAALTLAAAAAFGLDLADRSALSCPRPPRLRIRRPLPVGRLRPPRSRRASRRRRLPRPPALPPDHWDLRLLIVHTARGPKADRLDRRHAAQRRHLPLLPRLGRHLRGRPRRRRAALAARDLAPSAPHGAQLLQDARLHARHRPALLYWNGTTLAVIARGLGRPPRRPRGLRHQRRRPARQGPVPPRRGRRAARRPPRRRARRAFAVDTVAPAPTPTWSRSHDRTHLGPKVPDDAPMPITCPPSPRSAADERLPQPSPPPARRS
jgi:diphosphomevalonate decarboxylase